ncbi:MAG: NusG domain II-containing protein [Treponema sp.]|nr:NusG domain II-containing protein [Treponema sp.]
MKHFPKPADIIIILVVTGLTIFSAYSAYIKPQGKAYVLIRGQDSEWTFPIEAAETVVVKGVLGETTVRINDNRAWVESSPCENQTCVASGNVVRHGQWAACLPNNVLLIIQGSGDDDVDIIAW